MKKKEIFKRLKFPRYLLVAGLFFAATACEEDIETDPMQEEEEMPTGMFTVADQVISQNSVMVQSVTLDKSGWVVLHEDSGSGPVVPAIVSKPVYLEAGTTENVMVMLKEGYELEMEEKLWVMLHTDTGAEEVYEFDTDQTVDTPITDADGNIRMTPVMVSAPQVEAMAQAVNANTVTVELVKAATDGWIVIHNDNGSGEPVLPGIIGKTWVEAGVNENVVIELDSTVMITPGQKLFPMLHLDSPADMEYTFPENGDVPEMFNGDIIMTSFEVLAPSGSMEVTDQTISQNTIVVPSVEMSGKGWVVVHADNGNNAPVVPEIISVPTQVEAGMSTDVMVELKEGVSIEPGAKVWVMLHTDNGEIGAYEFDGASGLDGPLVSDGNISMQQIMLNAPSIMATDQAVVNSTVTIESVMAAADGWIVIHNDNGNGEPVLPGIIGKTWVEAGLNENVVIELDETVNYTAGQKLFPMLHVDSPADMEYTFPENGDVPEVFGEDIIMVSFSVTE